MDLKQTLDNKMTLRFKNGRFRILTVSDLHGVCNFDRRVVRDLNAICDGIKPDLVLFLGDIVWRDAAENADALYAYLREVTAYLEENRIPWAHVFGNHDAERGYPVDRQQEVYERFPCCLAKRGPADVAGTGNYILPVYASEGEKIAYAVWGLDSHRDMHEYLLEAGFPDDYRLVMMPDPMHLSQSYDAIRFNQIRWYRDTAEALEKQNGEKVPGLMVFHIPLPEFQIPYKNVAQTGYRGNRREQIGNAPVNSGLFSAMVENGDIRTIICGHDHINDYEGTFLGIKMACDAGLSYDVYCDDDLRGGRVVDIDENDPWHVKTYMVRASDFVPDYPGTERRKP